MDKNKENEKKCCDEACEKQHCCHAKEKKHPEKNECCEEPCCEDTECCE